MSPGLPARLKLEVKFTTRTSIELPERERVALSSGADGLGAIAALFLCGDRDLDGRWLLVGAAAPFGGRKADSLSATKDELARMARSGGELEPLRAPLAESWPRWLQALLAPALAGRRELREELSARRAAGRLDAGLGPEPVLELDHIANASRVVERHGESVAGGVFQDLLAALLELIGYGSVISNTTGVPDIVAALVPGGGLVELGALPRAQVLRLLALCEGAGEASLADRLRGRLG